VLVGSLGTMQDLACGFGGPKCRGRIPRQLKGLGVVQGRSLSLSPRVLCCVVLLVTPTAFGDPHNLYLWQQYVSSRQRLCTFGRLCATITYYH
jgi:hypothetical protein